MGRKLSTAELLAPKKEVSFLLTDMYLSNLSNDGAPPTGELAELYLFIERQLRGKFDRRIVYTIAADSEAEALVQLREFASRSDVELVEEKTRKTILKDWLRDEQTAGG